MKIVFLEKGFEIPLDSTEIEYTRTNSLFSDLIGEWSYPFTLKATAEILARFNFPNLPNTLSTQEKTYKAQLYDGSFLHAQGDFVLQYADDEIITATLTATPGNISKKIWTKKLNTFDLGQDTIPTQAANNTVYVNDAVAKTGTFQYYVLGNESGAASLNDAVQFIFFDTRIEIKIGTTVHIDKSFKPTNEQRRAGAVSIFNAVLEEFNNSQSNHEILYDEKQLIAIFTGNFTDPLTIKFTFYKLDTTEIQTVFNFSLSPQTVNTITNYLDGSLLNTWTKPYFFPEVVNSKHYSESAGFNGVINKTENGQIKRNTNLLTEKTKYSLVPMLKLKWFLEKVFGDLGYTITGDFLTDQDIQKILIFNLQTTDKLLPNVFYPINIHDSVITYAKHLPSVSLGEYTQALIDEFGLSFEFNILTKTLDISFFNTISGNADILNLEGRMSRKRRNNLIKNKKTQVKWVLSGDNLAKDDTAPYLPVPLNTVVEENPEDYQSTELKIPGLTQNNSALIPQIEASCISPLFSQTSNSNPLRLILWDTAKGKIETETLNFDLRNTTKGVYKRYLQTKVNFLDNAFNIEAGALLTKAELVSFRFRRKIYGFGVLWFAEELAVKFKAEQDRYFVELKLKRLNSGFLSDTGNNTGGGSGGNTGGNTGGGTGGNNGGNTGGSTEVGQNHVALLSYPQSPLREDISSVLQIGDFDFPTKADGSPLFQAVFVGSYRNQIQNPQNKLFKIGFSSVSRGSMIDDIETFTVNGNPNNLISPLTRWQRFIMRGIHTLGLNTGHPESNAAYTAYYNSLPENQKPHAIALFQMEDYYENNGGDDYKTVMTNHCNSYANYTFGDNLNGKANIGGLMLDWEADFTEEYIQDFVNRQYALHRYMKDAFDPGTKFSIMYNSMPYKVFGAEQSWYNMSPMNPVWNMTVQHTPNSIAKNMPNEFVGQKLSDLGNDLLIFTEAYFMFEDFEPQGAALSLPSGTQGGDIQYIDHFGSNTHWYRHWASFIGFSIEINKKVVGNRMIMVNICNTAGALNGYYQYWNPEQGQVVYPLNFIGDLAYEIPSWVMEAKCLLIIFSGASYSFWQKDMFGATTTGPNWNTPIPTNIAKYDIINIAPPEYGGYTQLARDLSNYASFGIAVKRFSNLKIKPDGTNLDTVSSIMDGNEIFLNENTEVDYLDGQGFRAITAAMWRDETLSPVRAIVNEPKGEIAVLAFRTYQNSDEPTQFKIRYNKNGFNWVSPVLNIREATPELWKFKM